MKIIRQKTQTAKRIRLYNTMQGVALVLLVFTSFFSPYMNMLVLGILVVASAESIYWKMVLRSINER